MSSSKETISDDNQAVESDAVLEQRKMAVTEKLKRRDDERVGVILQRKAEKENDVVKEETTDYFRKQFTNIKEKIDESLSSIKSIPEASRSSRLDEIVVMVQSLQKLLTDSTQFLSSYNVQSAQETINIIKEAMETQRADLVPKKKFAFKGKKKAAGEAQVGTDSTDSAARNGRREESTSKSSQVTDMFGFSNRSNEELILSAADLYNKKVRLSSLKNCTVRLHGSMLALTLDKLEDCIVSSGPVSGSVFVDDCTSCQISVACQQLRVHSTTSTTFYLHVTSRAIIEDCSGITTAPYTSMYSDIEKHFKDSGLDRERNSWDDLDDFNWLAKDKKSPNWSVLELERRREWK